jgi:hypothetical protein
MTYYGYPVYPNPLVNPANIQIINTSTALGQSAYGVTYLVQNSGSTTITLPNLLVGSITGLITIVSDSSTGAVTINAAGTNTIRSLGVASNSFSLTPGDSVVLENNGTSWSVVSNSSWKANLASPTFTGIPTGPTAAQFNNSTQFSTTAFVRQASGNYSNVVGYTGTAVQPVTDFGAVIELNSTSAFTITTPPFTSAPKGTSMTYANIGSSIVTINAGAGMTFNTLATAGLASVTISPGQTFGGVFDGVSFLIISGFGAGVTSSNGYQKFSDGLILQWGYVPSTGAVGTYTVTLPITYPRGMLQASISNAINNSPVTLYMSAANWSATGFTAFTSNGSASWSFSWMSLGY